MPRPTQAYLSILCAILALLPLQCVSAQEDFARRTPSNQAMNLPTGLSEWINSPPISLEQIQGKGIVLWFFEETCPRCVAKWPELYALEQKLKDLPIQFVAVNSGTARGDLSGYLQKVNCLWPVICDTQRTFEKACGVPEISLNNIMQCYYIGPEGNLRIGNWADIEGTAMSASRGATWSLEPSAYSEGIRDVVKNIEFGNYPRAILRLKNEYRKPAIKAETKSLIDTIKKIAAEDAQRLEKKIDKKEAWSSYLTIIVHEQRFYGLPLSKVLMKAKAELSRAPEVKQMLSKSATFQ